MEAISMNEDDMNKEEVNHSETVIKQPLIKNKDGVTVAKRANLTKLLTYYDENLTDLFMYNETTHNIEILEDRKLGIHTLKKGIYEDSATIQIASYISSRYLVDFNNGQIADEVQAVARTRSYNPIKTFLQKALINHEKKAPFKIIQQYLNIADTEYNRIALDLFFRGAVARIFEPGCQFDYCLDLVGPQGGRKTSFLRQVFMNWYTDQIESFNKKDDLAVMVKAWLVNDDELVATKNMNFEGVKKSITLSVISFRPPYGRASQTLPVDFVYSRTTNETEHLGDATGDRRFIGVEVEKVTPKHKKTIIEKDLIDIWGNYYASYMENPKLYYDELDPEGILIEEERKKFKKEDYVTEMLDWYLNQLIPMDFYEEYIESYNRRLYYSELLSTGVAYRPGEKGSKKEWEGVRIRDRVSVGDILNELFHDDNRPEAIRVKINRYFSRLSNWEKKKNIKFGKRVTSGFQRKVGKKVKK